MTSFKEAASIVLDIPPVDAEGVDERASFFMKHAFTPVERLAGIEALIGVLDLTTLKATDTPERVKALVDRAVHPDPTETGCPRTAAVCVYSDLAGVAFSRRDHVRVPSLRIACVAGGFPHGRVPLPVKLLEARTALEAGADEIDMVLDRGAFLSGRWEKAFTDIAAMKEVCAAYEAHLKVILETGELETYDHMFQAGYLAILAGADFIKTSTGKTSPAATPESTLVLLDTVRFYEEQTGVRIGVKPAGGVKTADQALGLIPMVEGVLGVGEFQPSRVRLGASGLLDDLVVQRQLLLH